MATPPTSPSTNPVRESLLSIVHTRHPEIQTNAEKITKWAASLQKSGRISVSHKDALTALVDDVMMSVQLLELDLAMEIGKQINAIETRSEPTLGAEDIAAAVVAKMGRTMQQREINTDEIARAVTEKIATATAIPKSTYANVVKVPNALQVTPTIPPPLHSIVVFPQLPPGTAPPPAADTRKKVMETLKPADTGLQIAAVRNLGRSGGVMISTTSATAQAKLLQHPALTSEGLRTEPAKRGLPRLKIFDAPKDLDATAIAEAVRNQNTEDIPSTEFHKQFKIVHTFPSKIRNNIAIAECTPEIRQRLLQQGRIYIGFESCRTMDYIQITRCFKCQAYGHPSKYCNATEDTCSLCAGQHFYTSCPHKEEPRNHKCANCMRARVEDQAHPAISSKCPAYARALDASIRKTDYGLHQ
ncbi:hypothetical protein RI129_000128 [Pyrocoelia pectoralis]|uniref:Gag-like protein n=1 Tax=Pyrocoelia pectoralis TaxID=417401 RepID=A0AAN7ZEF0_9COLE